MEHEQRLKLKKYLDIVLRSKKIIIFCLLVSIVAGLGKYLRTPKTYESTALIRYQQQSVNPSRMSPDVQTRIREMVSTVGQQITSRTSLESLIKKFDLYTEMREKIPMEDVVVRMRNDHISIRPESRGDIFRVSFNGGNPKKVMLVTNELAAKFIEENLRFREERASETSAYVKDELQMAKKSLDELESTMRDYKLKFYNEMPQQRDLNMSRLNSLQTQYQGNQDS
ncbi:MAG: Wzz/FepE/Etk N-terminal domain-containing protein, partial [Thermodesulfobacteriota bacterium]|nr:Wzz/FepE/Etk N-terminal domain-containing protein [Thermodesulfobacteriota bacterium]